MKITDREALQLLKRANSETLWEYVDAYPEDELDNQSELDLVMDELEYLIFMYEDEGTIHYDNLRYSKMVLKETHNGKTMPVTLPDFEFKYTKQEVQDAKDTVNEYKRLKRLFKEYYG